MTVNTVSGALGVLAWAAVGCTLLIPALSALVARILYAHSQAVDAWYRIVISAFQAYRKVHRNVMEETQ